MIYTISLQHIMDAQLAAHPHPVLHGTESEHRSMVLVFRTEALARDAIGFLNEKPIAPMQPDAPRDVLDWEVYGVEADWDLHTDASDAPANFFGCRVLVKDSIAVKLLCTHKL